jgi:hypothetical protein
LIPWAPTKNNQQIAVRWESLLSLITTSIMKALFILVLVVIVCSCHCREHIKPDCGTAATVVDLASSGCTGLGFKLSDGTLILPMSSFCGTGKAHNPADNFQMVAGQQVMIGYESVGSAPCGALSSARITCITLVESGEK